MRDEITARILRNIAGIDTRSIKRTIQTIRRLRAMEPDMDLQIEHEDLCFWWTKRRENRTELFNLRKGGFC